MLSWKNVKINDSFFSNKQGSFLKNMLMHQWDALNDFYSEGDSHAVRNLKMASGVIEKSQVDYGDFGKESDLSKWLEAASASLVFFRDLEVEEKIDYIVDLFEKAQPEDGYLNTYYLATNQNLRFTSVSELHELYCAGHLAEAAVTYFQATGKDKLLKIVCRYLDLIINTFGDGEGKLNTVPGHEEIELALVRVYEVTGEEKYLNFAKWLIDNRGTNNYYEKEATFRKGSKFFDYDYYQSQAPLRKQMEAVGHAVRATYLYCGATDVAKYFNDKTLFEKMKELFDDVINNKMYVTGSIGAHSVSERFSLSYDLPSDRAYSETCASIGLALWAIRMLDVELNEKFAGTMERALFNTMLSGVSVDGTKYFYVNPLSVDPEVAEFRFDQEHVKTQRVAWFGCACCPPNIARTLSTFGKFIYTEKQDGIAVNLYVDSVLKCEKGRFMLKGNLFDSGKFTMIAPKGSKVYFRVPYWANAISINGESRQAKNGYIPFIIENGECTIEISFKPEWIYPNSKISDCSGKTTVQYGPFIYCAEQVDNGKYLASLSVESGREIRVVGDLFGLPTLEVDGLECLDNFGLYNKISPAFKEKKVKLVPYCLWNNRGRGEMRVWLNRTVK